MKIICCYADALRDQTIKAISKYAPSCEMIDTSSDNFAYWHAISERWTGTYDLMTIEQDIEIHAAVIPTFLECPEPWCVYGYKSADSIQNGFLTYSLGCTRFRKELQQHIPATQIAGATITQFPGRETPTMVVPWMSIDARIALHLERGGYEPHVHGEVNHYHPYPDNRVNARLDAAIERYLYACVVSEGRYSEEKDAAWDNFRRTYDLARDGTLNINPEA